MAGDEQIQAMENSAVGCQGRRLEGPNLCKSMGRPVARSAMSLLLAGIVAALVYQSTEREQAPLLDYQGCTFDRHVGTTGGGGAPMLSPRN